jgi:hypothetical protein
MLGKIYLWKYKNSPSAGTKQLVPQKLFHTGKGEKVKFTL